MFAPLFGGWVGVVIDGFIADVVVVLWLACALAAPLVCGAKVIPGGWVGVVIDCFIDHAPPAGMAAGAVDAKPATPVLACTGDPISDSGGLAPPGPDPGGGWAESPGWGGFGCGTSIDEVFCE